MKLCDLDINMAKERHDNDPKILEALYVKKEYLYPLAKKYLKAVHDRHPNNTSVLQFAYDRGYSKQTIDVFAAYTNNHKVIVPNEIYSI